MKACEGYVVEASAVCSYQHVCPHKDMCPGGREGCTEPCPRTRGTSGWPTQAGGCWSHRVTSWCPFPLLLRGGETFRRCMAVKWAEQESCPGTGCPVTEVVRTVCMCSSVQRCPHRQKAPGSCAQLPGHAAPAGERLLSTVCPSVLLEFFVTCTC